MHPNKNLFKDVCLGAEGVSHHALISSCWKVPGCEMGINTRPHLDILAILFRRKYFAIVASKMMSCFAILASKMMDYYANHHPLSLTPRAEMCSISDAAEVPFQQGPTLPHANNITTEPVALWIIALCSILCCFHYLCMPRHEDRKAILSTPPPYIMGVDMAKRPIASVDIYQDGRQHPPHLAHNIDKQKNYQHPLQQPSQQPPQPANNNDDQNSRQQVADYQPPCPVQDNFLRLTLPSGEIVTVETPHNYSISVSVKANVCI